MNKQDQIFEYIQNELTTENLTKNSNIIIGITAMDIEHKFGIVRNNASTILNNLVKDGKLVKLIGRPVQFIPKDTLSSYDITIVNNQISKDALYEYIHKASTKATDPFESLSGHKSSLFYQIDQAKAAILYPPNGLHTMIIGESGTGKTKFAKTMYKFAMSKKKSKDNFPFISFNCSDYYNNPQLLLSQLFGHIKGAFTGAESDKIGLVEKANGGILFLDEVHRLPPDGQEMLFYLMDKGQYNRLGETQKVRNSKILIIAATTENPNEVLLKTFLRRIPVLITLPSLKEKSIKEKIEIIENLFIKEAIRLNMKLDIHQDVIKTLAIYECPGNIGQLKSDIKLLCARSLLNHSNKSEYLDINFEILPKKLKNESLNVEKLSEEDKEYIKSVNSNTIVSPSKEIKYKLSAYLNYSVYDKISESIKEFKNIGYSEEDIKKLVSKDIEDYYQKVYNEISYKNLRFQELYKFIDKKIVDLTYKIIEFASLELNREFNTKSIICLAFHLNSLLQRVEENHSIINTELNKVEKLYSKEFITAGKIVDKINKTFNIIIPDDEKGYIAILLANTDINKSIKEKVGVLILAHGASTATSIANVCNRLMNISYVKAIDMPLEESVEETYKKALQMVKSIDMGKGVLILSDMGSLNTFGLKITQDTGIITKTIDRVTTPLVLEILGRIMYKDDIIDDIYNSFSNRTTYVKNHKQNAILSVCATGEGTGSVLQKMVYNILKEIHMQDIKVIPINFMAIKNNKVEYQKLNEDYNILACVGSIKPPISIPFVPIEDFINGTYKNILYNILNKNTLKHATNTPNIFIQTKKILEKHLLFVNPQAIIESVREFIKKINIIKVSDNESIQSSLILHIGCMLERIIQGHKIIFDNKESLIKNEHLLFNNLKENIIVIEKKFNTKISDDEICYVIQVINNCN